MSAIAVFLKTENPAVNSARHSASATLAALVLASNSAKLITISGKKVLHLLTGETWRQVKDRVRPAKCGVPLLNAPDYHIPCLQTYPPPAHDDSARRAQARLWLTATNF